MGHILGRLGLLGYRFVRFCPDAVMLRVRSTGLIGATSSLASHSCLLGRKSCSASVAAFSDSDSASDGEANPVPPPPTPAVARPLTSKAKDRATQRNQDKGKAKADQDKVKHAIPPGHEERQVCGRWGRHVSNKGRSTTGHDFSRMR